MRSLLDLNYGGEEPREFAVVRDRIPAFRLAVKVRSLILIRHGFKELVG